MSTVWGDGEAGEEANGDRSVLRKVIEIDSQRIRCQNHSISTFYPETFGYHGVVISSN